MRNVLSSVGLVLVASLMATPALSQETKKESGGQQPGGNAQMEEMMAAWLKYAAPGEHHAHLKPLAGKWQIAAKCRMAPDQPWQPSQSTCESEWILGDRFLCQKVNGDPMPGTDAPFEGFGILGYDNYKQRYISVWMDNMGTMCMTAEGTCDPSGKSITFVGSYDDPMTGSKKQSRMVYRIESNDRYVMEFYDKGPDGKEFTSMEMTSTRK